MEYMTVAVIAVLAIVAVNAMSARVGVAAPLVLVAAGVGVSALPFVPPVLIPPEWILMGVLPPLLYSAAARMPTMDFRRDFASISGLSVVLVLLTSLVLGVFFTAVIPSVDLALGVALGAIVSPTDAVATAIARRQGVPGRTVTLLEGESMLNDASALVILRSAVAASAGTISLWHVLGDFAYAIVLAVVVGVLIGALNLLARRHLRHATLSTLVSFVTPFVAYAPTEHLGASGLVAAVVAGLVTGWGGPKYLRPQDRIAQNVNWRTAEILLEGGVFAVMGLELAGVLSDARDTATGISGAVIIGLVTIPLLLALRTGYVAVLLRAQHHRVRRIEKQRTRLDAIADLIESGDDGSGADPRIRSVIQRRIADLDFHSDSRLGRRDGVVLVWAGMRGVITLAAAQTLARDTPDRAALVLIAFVVAAGTLLIQGGTLSWVVRALGPAVAGGDGTTVERQALTADLDEQALSALDDPEFVSGFGAAAVSQVRRSARHHSSQAAADANGKRGSGEDAPAAEARDLRLKILQSQRQELLRKRSVGVYSSAVLEWMLTRLDAEQVRLELDQ